MPESLDILELQEIARNQQPLLFGQNSYSQQTLNNFSLIGCDFPPPNIIILDTGDPPSNDFAIHECLKMYQNEINTEYINVIADEAIFRRDYGIFNMAGILGVQFLDKLEKCIDFRVTSRVLELIWVAVVWYLYFQWTSYWWAHWFGIHWGIFELQYENLKAFSPLFLVAGKSNYARSVSGLLRRPGLGILLRRLRLGMFPDFLDDPDLEYFWTS
ncbi:hypothetical protein C1645_840978 [Glomus cerebriforme]|uniref:Uncharacterized protein n=1 Tax=Glomus cerebriforme TaxID=658196 RepID=A0A397S3D1_9GLOM|nr:hypothetical protein C1645_840978 [Glomus cerebriforme]